MGVISEILESLIEAGSRIVKLVKFGEKDNVNAFQLNSFGEDFNVPKGYDALYMKTSNSSEPVCIGFLNKVVFDDLNPGDKQIFSTNQAGDAIAAYIKLLNDGIIHFNGDTDFIAGFNDLKAGFDELKEDYNNHIHQIPSNQVVIQVTGGSGAPAIGVKNPAPIDLSETSDESAASIDTSKKENLKTE